MKCFITSGPDLGQATETEVVRPLACNDDSTGGTVKETRRKR